MEPQKDNLPHLQGGASNPVGEERKNEQLENHRTDPAGPYMTTDQGLRVSDVDNSLKGGERGPTLMEDFLFRERLTHLDHEPIPERVVHARGSAAHGYFQPYESMARFTRARFLQDPNVRTPVFVRFSTVVGSRGSADTVRDVRGFATKFYTEEGNFDLVANNMAPFFIQDGIKFPDLVHAIKPDPDSEMPQASAAHDTFWDFASLMPETAHMLMWVLSDRALPRSFRMMEGFGVHTFRWINNEGRSRFVKYHWRPVLGVHSLVFDEAQKLAGKDPDWLRRDLWEAIEEGHYPEYELLVQLVEEEDEHRFDFDLLDATKIIPEELVPLTPVGRMVLNRNPDNFFAETEQVAFHPGNLVPGIDVTNDPLLQARLFSYLDTQLNRFHSSNFTELPINRPVCPVHNFNGAGFMKTTVPKGKVNYFPNSIGGGLPSMAPENQGGYVHYQEKVEGHKIRQRSASFSDHFSQATLFWNSQTKAEQERIVSALHFELGKVKRKEIRQRMVTDILNHISHELATRVAKGIGVDAPSGAVMSKIKDGAEALTKGVKDKLKRDALPSESPSLSPERMKKPAGIRSRRVAVLVAEGFDGGQVETVKAALKAEGAQAELVGTMLGPVRAADGSEQELDKSYLTTASVMYDAVLIPGGAGSVKKLMENGDTRHFINEAFRHCKPIGALGEGVALLAKSDIKGVSLDTEGEGNLREEAGVVTLRKALDLGAFTAAFISAIAAHRHWSREEKMKVPA
jgi:catalase